MNEDDLDIFQGFVSVMQQGVELNRHAFCQNVGFSGQRKFQSAAQNPAQLIIVAVQFRRGNSGSGGCRCAHTAQIAVGDPAENKAAGFGIKINDAENSSSKTVREAVFGEGKLFEDRCLFPVIFAEEPADIVK